ncbi:MAG TPA: hypothetical protein PKL77_10600 [Candidatus Omnitrophota bacterium]|nr:hypothetical protein [Candidatus Omnitrophota bacterium]HPT08041.1 hypothetical protein [Candidatus Omnitrophota bacterium]
MAKKEFSNEDFTSLPGDEAGFDAAPVKSSKLAGFLGKLFAVTKFVLGLLLLPFVYSITVSFLKELPAISDPLVNTFWAGVISIVLVYLFVWEPAVLYSKGQGVVAILFMFLKPLVKVAPYLLPIYTIIVCLVYWFISLFNKDLIGYFIFLFGFTLGMHLIFSAKSLRGKKGDFLKGNYIFGFSFVYILNVAMAAFFLNLVFEKYSFVGFADHAYLIASNIFQAVFTQLFAVK